MNQWRCPEECAALIATSPTFGGGVSSVQPSGWGWGGAEGQHIKRSWVLKTAFEAVQSAAQVSPALVFMFPVLWSSLFDETSLGQGLCCCYYFQQKDFWLEKRDRCLCTILFLLKIKAHTCVCVYRKSLGLYIYFIYIYIYTHIYIK